MRQGGFATRSSGTGSNGGIRKYLAAVVFFPMLWLRGLVILLGRTVSALCTISGVAVALVSLYSRYHYWMIAARLILAGFLFFLALQLYDSILVRLNPTNRTFLFYQ